MSPEVALSACRFLHDASAMLLFGASAYLSVLVPARLARDIGTRLGSLAAGALALAAATAVAALPLEAAVIGEGWRDALDPGTVLAVLFETTVGQAWQVQMIAAVILAVTLAIPSGHRQAATMIASGLLLASIALTGHAVMQEGWPGIGHRLNDALHILAAGAWLGALVPLLPILRTLADDERRSEAGIALRRFSTAGHIIVALVVASGLVNTALVLGRWPTDWGSPYQAMLAVKIALVAAMVGLAIINRYVLVPRLARDRSRMVRAIRFGTAAEIALGLSVVALVAVFGMLDPN